MFDITDQSSFEKMIKWKDELKLQAPENLIIKIVGNKNDLKNKPSCNIVDDSKILEFISNNEGLEFLETSAKTGENVEKLFRLIAEDLPDDLFKSSEIGNDGDDSGNRGGNNGLVDLNQRVFNNGKSCNC